MKRLQEGLTEGQTHFQPIDTLDTIINRIKAKKNRLSPQELQQIDTLTEEFEQKVSKVLVQDKTSSGGTKKTMRKVSKVLVQAKPLEQESLPTGMTLETLLLPLEKLPLPEDMDEINKHLAVISLEKSLISKNYRNEDDLHFTIAEIIELPLQTLLKSRGVSHKTVAFLTSSLALLNLQPGTTIPEEIKLAYQKTLLERLDPNTFQKLLLPIAQLPLCDDAEGANTGKNTVLKRLAFYSPSIKLIGDLIGRSAQHNLTMCKGLGPNSLKVINESLIAFGLSPRLHLSKADQAEYQAHRSQFE